MQIYRYKKIVIVSTPYGLLNIMVIKDKQVRTDSSQLTNFSLEDVMLVTLTQKLIR